MAWLRGGCGSAWLQPNIAMNGAQSVSWDFGSNSSAFRPICLTVLFLVPLEGWSQVVSSGPPKVVRLRPNAFSGLPPNILRELNRRSCRVPQPPPFERMERLQNVIQGEFAKQGQSDWAVLCFTRSVTRILVFLGGSEKGPSEVHATRSVPFNWTIYWRRFPEGNVAQRRAILVCHSRT